MNDKLTNTDGKMEPMSPEISEPISSCKFAEPFLFLVIFSLSIQSFCYQSIMLSAACKFNFNKSICDGMEKRSIFLTEVDEQAQITTATWSLIANVGFAILSAISAKLIGKCTDYRFNKRNALSMMSFGATVCSVNLTAANHIPMKVGSYILPIFLILQAYATGMFASLFIVLSTTNAYLAAVLTPDDNRTLRYSYLQIAYFTAQVVAPWTSGIIINYFSKTVALCLSTICGFLGFTTIIDFS
ncbi:hypothetical protein ACOME3_001270 [Neoechinorhynchus agilis]